jgi:hypothetical protein
MVNHCSTITADGWFCSSNDNSSAVLTRCPPHTGPYHHCLRSEEAGPNIQVILVIYRNRSHNQGGKEQKCELLHKPYSAAYDTSAVMLQSRTTIENVVLDVAEWDACDTMHLPIYDFLWNLIHVISKYNDFTQSFALQMLNALDQVICAIHTINVDPIARSVMSDISYIRELGGVLINEMHVATRHIFK